MPCPERIVEGFKLMPIGFSSFVYDRYFGRGLWASAVEISRADAEHLASPVLAQ